MNNYKIMAGLLGLALTAVAARAAAPSLSYKINGNEFIITYTGTLYQSSDAVNWTEVASASSPYKVTLGDKKLFFCAKGESDTDTKNITIPLSDTVDLDMIWIDPGTFMMGSPEDELGRDDDETQHQVTLTSGYWLGKYEVTQAQYKAVMGENPSEFVGDNNPVENVNWNDAANFCAKLTEIEKAAGRLPEGYEYTLPTEAQWEYACRAGTTTAFNNGTNIETEEQIEGECPNLDPVGWYYYNCDYTTHSVGQKQPNAWGLYDMHGNVYEWCLDWYGDYPASSVTDPTGASTGSERIFRGGGWFNFAGDCRSANRLWYAPSVRINGLGFRLALVPVPSQDKTIPLTEDVNLDMIWIEPGTFIMGSPEDELGRGDNETQHEVTLTRGYWLGKYEVTQAQYEAVMGTNPSYFKGADLPVENVNWFEALAFCEKLTAIAKAAGLLPEGYEYTLPTEAQWEYACRAGTTTAFNNGTNIETEEQIRGVCPNLDPVGWYDDNSNYTTTTHPVGQKQPNAWGLYDMHGNVEEWCLDWWGDYPASSVTDPTGPATGDYRMQRGGSCDGFTYAGMCRSAERSRGLPGSINEASCYTGFRVALAPLTKTKTKNMTIPLSEDVDLDMIWIEPGTFMMGSVSELGSNDDETWHDVTLTQGYWLGKYEVTQAQYQAIMGTNPSYIKGVDLPVEQVSWNDATNFCAKLTARERAAGRLPAGYEYTLPTEAQWEYACRAGTWTALNSGENLSDEEQCPEMDKVGWYYYNSDSKPHPVGQKQPNAWGLYDMHGNVYEWCLDWYGDYPIFSVTDPTGPDTGDLRVQRGGGRSLRASGCRSAWRSSSISTSRYRIGGFRVALAQKPIEPQPLTITIDATKAFDGTPLVSDYTVATVEGLLSGDKLTSGVVTTKSADKDSYSYIDGTSEITTPFDTAKGIANYIVTYVINQKIQAAGLIITINDTKVYDGTPLVSDYTKATTKGLVDGDYLTAGAVTTAGSDVGTYNLITTSITVPFQTANGIGNYFVIYAIIQKIIQSDHSNKTIPLAEDVNLDMIWIEPGTFIMGSPEDELGRDDKEVQHEVTLTQGYWMGKYEVTQTQYEAIMGTNPSWRHKGADLPVDDVSWLEAMEFCEKLTAIERAAGRLPRGYGYTLPTEEQWEYACRAGTTTALNSGKNLSGEWECPEMDEVGWYYCNSNDTTHPVGQKLPNAWGLYDMHGNVEEFCLDEDKDPFWKGWHVVCGGDYSSFADDCRSGAHGTAMNAGFIGKGFRVALAPVDLNITIPLSNSVELTMIWIEPGTFTMGSPKDELGRNSNETQHEVTLTQGYWLGKYEVTQAQYKAVTGSNPSEFIGGDLPVENVTWYEAKAFCAKLTEIEKAAGRLPEGYEYTLPTEAQWEYVCRAGMATALNSAKNLSDKNECPEMDEVGWYRYNSGDKTHPVGQKKMNAWGLYDMHGNVEEWCLDWAKDYPAGAATDPTGPETGTYRIVRGGGWNEDACYCRSASRDISEPDSFWPNTGFRVALAPVPESRNMTIPISEDVDLDMIWINPGTFIMGSPEDELGRDSEETQHKVTLTQGYWLGKYEVTQAQFKAVMNANPSWYKGDDQPVENVDWEDAMEFCAKLTEIEKAAGRLPEGYEYTLPTEAQWEYACRAGTTTALNSGKNLSSEEKCPEMDEVGWYGYGYNTGEYDSNGKHAGEGKTYSVGQKLPNAWGLYDMHGNVNEWCLDWYRDGNGDYPASSVTDPTGDSTGLAHIIIIRGGGWGDTAGYCRSADRHSVFTNYRSRSIGFRVALTPVK